MKPSAARSSGVASAMLVRRELELDELVVGQIAIERLDHPLPVLVGMRIKELRVVADLMRLVFRIARQRQPHARHLLAKARRREQTIHQPLVRIRLLIGAGNSSTSCGVGGRPVRSNVARRISVRLSASFEGDSFSCSSFARMK